MNSLSDLNELLVANNCVHRISVQLSGEGGGYDLLLSISASELVGGDTVRVLFTDVSQLSICDFGGGLTQLMHMSVRKLDSGLDRLRYKFSDLEDDKVSFFFSSFSAA